jgi:hypothetical protein
MPGMTVSEVNALGAHVERQGVKVTRTKNGLLLRLPNQDTCMVHFTSSDVNQKHQVRRDLKRAGITMPDEPKNAGGKPTKRTKELVRDALIALGDPDPVRIMDIKAKLAAPLGPNTVTNVLVGMGYHPSGTRASRRYHRPNMVSLLPQPEPTPNVAPPVETVDMPTATPDFLDLVGSRMIDPDTLPDHLTLGDIRAMLGALGLGMQIRVWNDDQSSK